MVQCFREVLPSANEKCCCSWHKLLNDVIPPCDPWHHLRACVLLSCSSLLISWTSSIGLQNNQYFVSEVRRSFWIWLRILTWVRPGQGIHLRRTIPMATQGVLYEIFLTHKWIFSNFQAFFWLSDTYMNSSLALKLTNRRLCSTLDSSYCGRNNTHSGTHFSAKLPA